MQQLKPNGLQQQAITPWYRQRWPWLLMLGPTLVLVAGSYTAYLAVTREDAMVVDDYYKQGKAINQDLRRDRVATALRLSFEARYDADAGRLVGTLESFGRPVSQPFLIRLAHPTLPKKDLALNAQPDAAGHFSVALSMLERAHWRVVVEGGARDWRLARGWSWPGQRVLTIVADPEV